jgi:tetratricopeptide (TPR) repeat protein
MRTSFLTATVVLGVTLCALPASAKDNVIHMMTMPTTVRGTVEIETGDIKAAIRKSLSESKSSRPHYRAAAFTNLCIGYAKLGEYATALEYCDKSVTEERNTWIALINRGAVQYLLGNYTSSVVDLQRALELRSGVRETRNNLARAKRSYASLAGNQSIAENPAK